MSLEEHEKPFIGSGRSDGNTVGPGHPPKQHQYPKGTSGNPKGRPRNSPKPHQLLSEELKKPITITMGNKKVRVTRLEAMFLQLSSLALSGHAGATKFYLERLEQARLRKRRFKEEENPVCDVEWTTEFEENYQMLENIEIEDGDDEDDEAENGSGGNVSPDALPSPHQSEPADPHSGQESATASVEAGDTISNKTKENEDD